MYVCMYVCNVRMYELCMYVYVFSFIHLYIYTYIHTYIHTYVYAYLYIYIYMYIDMYRYLHFSCVVKRVHCTQSIRHGYMYIKNVCVCQQVTVA